MGSWICILLQPPNTSSPLDSNILLSLATNILNKIYRFVTSVYKYNYHNSGHYP
jgi:hypothetical protein